MLRNYGRAEDRGLLYATLPTLSLCCLRPSHVDLRHGSVESLPFGDNSFDKALAIN
jgi:hypothetical protein